MHNKQKLIKAGFFAFSSILVLVVATVAWFMSANPADTDGINSSIVHGKYKAVLFESPDANKDGIQDKDIDGNVIWNEVTDPGVAITNMVPGEIHFYKIEVTTYAASITLDLKLNNIQTTIPAGSAATKADVLGRLHVYFETKDSSGNPIAGTSTIDSSMLAFFGSNPDLTDKTVYHMDLTLYTNQTFTIYYNVSIDANHSTADNIIQGAGVNIGTINFTETDN